MHELEIRGVVRGKSAVSGGSLATAVRLLALIESRFLGGNFKGRHLLLYGLFRRCVRSPRHSASTSALYSFSSLNVFARTSLALCS